MLSLPSSLSARCEWLRNCLKGIMQSVCPVALTESFQELVWLQIGRKGSGEEGKSWKLITFSVLVQDVENTSQRRDTGRRGCGQTKVSERTNPGHTLISDSWSRELCGSILLLFKLAHLRQLLAHKYMLHVNSL